jgi:hypothetical protein
MLIAFMRVPEGVAQEGHADLAGNAELEQAGIEGMAQVVELDIPDSCPADCCFPAGFETANRLAFKGEDQSRAPLQSKAG